MYMILLNKLKLSEVYVLRYSPYVFVYCSCFHWARQGVVTADAAITSKSLCS